MAEGAVVARRRTPLEKAPDPDLGAEPIPKTRYTSRELMQREWDGMWTRTWLLAGRESDVSRPGDYFTFEIGSESFLVVRQGDGSLHASYNVCLHRGLRLVEPGRGNATLFRCGFHGWVYGRDGALRAMTDAASFPPDLGRDGLCLRPVRCDTWGGFVFVSMDPEAPPLLDHLGVIPDHLDAYHFEEQSIFQDVTLEIDCNWKTCVDAFNEAYHVQTTHPDMLGYSDDVDVQTDCYERHRADDYRFATMPGGYVLDQDMHNLPRIQAGMNSRSYENLLLGDQEIRIRHFHQTLMQYVGRG